MKVKTFRDLLVWQKSHELTLSIYKLTSAFPSEEKFGLTSQLRRAAYSIPSNIVEGHSRSSKREFIHFLSISKGSLEELRYFLILSFDLKYIVKTEYDLINSKLEEVSKILYSFTKSLKN